ncbi:MAG TPA: sialidase family protein, partial [Longimicrobium sp.]
PTAALDPRGGTGFVAWVSTEKGTSDVYLARLDGGAPVRVNDVRGDAAPHEQAPAQVAVGPEGTVYVLWQNSREVPGRRFPASDLRLARSTDGGRTFAPAVTVNDDAGGLPSSHTFHDLRVAADGAVYVSWLDSRRRDTYRAAHPRPARAHKGHGGHGGEPEDPATPQGEIRVSRSTDGARTFGPEWVVDADVCPCCRTSLALGPDGSVYVAWRKVFAGDVRDVVVARMAPGGRAFGAPVRVHADGWVFPGCPHAGPSVAVDEGGRVHVAWYTGREGRQGLWYARSDDAARSFGAPAAVLAGGWVPPSRASLAASGGEVWVAWDDRRTANGALSLARVGEGAPAAATHPAPQGRSPALAAAGDRVVLAWLDRGSVRVRER